jgi:hypothetical protein
VSSKLHVSESFPHLNTVYKSHPHPYLPHVPPITFYHPNHTSLTVQILQSSLRSFLPSPGRSSPLGPIFSQTPFSLWFSFNLIDQDSHSHKSNNVIFPFRHSKKKHFHESFWRTVDVERLAEL